MLRLRRRAARIPPIEPPASIVDRVAPVPQRPLIGLALGGGAARGWAHIGVLNALSREGLAPDVIAGVSIGAVVGAYETMGLRDRLAEFARALTRRTLFAQVDIAIGGGGLMGGSRIAAMLARDFGAMRIETMDRPFAAVATEIATGNEIWLTRGLLVPALRASYALPGVFPPMRVGGRWLMDGALANPVPVTVARALGARVVIAVSLNADAMGRSTVIQDHGTDADDELRPVAEPRPRVRAVVNLGRDLGRGLGRALARPLRQARLRDAALAADAAHRRGPGIPTIMVRAFNASQERIARTRLAGDPPNVLIGPRLSHIGLFDFHRAEEAIALGEEAAMRLIPEIRSALEAVR